MDGECRLCHKCADLQMSHIVPAFVWRWLKDSSGNGHLRFGHQPNLRSQDGFKDYWLCQSCESRFSAWEADFANTIFYPAVENGIKQIPYSDWLLKFSTSLTWRVLSYIKHTAGLENYTPEMRARADNALNRWASFLLGNAPHPGEFEQHMFLVDRIVRHEGGELPTNINRYLLRSVDIDVVSSKAEAFVYVKLPHMVLTGFIHFLPRRKWLGTKIHVKRGTVGREQPEIPGEVGRFIEEKARRMQSIQSTISEKQKEKIDRAARKDFLRPDKSRSLEALEADFRLFGLDVVDPEDESSG